MALLRVSHELLPDLMRMLGKDNPNTISFYYTADNAVRGDAPMVSFWVDQWPDFSVIIKSVEAENPEFPYYDTCWSVWASDEEQARKVLTSPLLLNWSRPFRSRVLTVPALGALQEAAQARGQLSVRSKTLHVFQGDQASLPHCSLSEGFTLGELKPEMSDVLSGRYGTGDIPPSRSGPWIRACLERFPSSCIRDREGQLAAYAFLNFNGGLACVETLPQWRRKGLGKAVVTDVCRKVLQRGQRPFVFVPETNDPGRLLYTSVGMVAMATCHRCCFHPSQG